MSNSGINLKVYCMDGENSEVKRFSVDSHAVTNFVFMEEKLMTVFPGLRNGGFKINWKDADGDLISISNDEDFITALTEMNYNPKVLYITSTSKINSDAPRQFRVICDVCQRGISGYRYKCIECPNYDLCSTCEVNGNHSEHMVLRFPNSNTSFANIDRKMVYNAAKALKKSVFQAQRCARNSFRGGEKEKPSHGEETRTNSQNPSYGCPFAAADVDLLTQNIGPFVELFTRGAATSSNDQGTQNSMADLIRSVVEKFTGSVISEPNAASGSTDASSDSQKTSEDQPNAENKEKQNNSTENKQPQAQQATAPPAVNCNTNSQDMEWTLVSDNDDSNSQASARSKTPTIQPPKPPQDPRLMRGLAQLHEMGFSNENNFLNYMLELHDYNVGSVVKAILQLK